MEYFAKGEERDVLHLKIAPSSTRAIFPILLILALAFSPLLANILHIQASKLVDASEWRNSAR